MDLLTRIDFENLVSARGGMHVSLFMPTHRVSRGKETDEDKLRLKNLLTAATDELAAGGLERREIEQILAPAWELQGDTPAWSYMADGLALFLRDGEMMRYRVPLELPELVTVGDRFTLGPTVPLLSDQTFLVLAISQKRATVLRGSRARIDELDLADIPASLDEIVNGDGAFSEPSPRPTASGRAGGTGGTVFYGTGSPDESHAEDVRIFLRRVSDGVQSHFGDRSLPLVLAGLPEWLSGYRAVNRYGRVLEEAIEHNPDQMSNDTLHARAFEIVQRETERENAALLDRLGEQRARNKSAGGHKKVLEAADEGRVDTMLMTEDGGWPRGDGPRVLRLVEAANDPHQAIDAAAVATLRHGGSLRVVEALPGGDRTAAVMRY